jgi:DNA polymerase-3 subunit epsilon
MNKILWLDTETTGTDPKKHGIIQIAGIIEINGAIKESFEFLCDPMKKEIDPKALELNNFTLDEMKNFPSPSVNHKKLLKILSKYVDKYNKYDKFILAGQRIKFDFDFLYQFFLDCKDNYFFSYFQGGAFLDTLYIITFLQHQGVMPTLENRKNETIAKYFGYDVRNAHNAVEDIRMTRFNYYKMIERLKNEQIF